MHMLKVDKNSQTHFIWFCSDWATICTFNEHYKKKSCFEGKMGQVFSDLSAVKIVLATTVYWWGILTKDTYSGDEFFWKADGRSKNRWKNKMSCIVYCWNCLIMIKCTEYGAEISTAHEQALSNNSIFWCVLMFYLVFSFCADAVSSDSYNMLSQVRGWWPQTGSTLLLIHQPAGAQ